LSHLSSLMISSSSSCIVLPKFTVGRTSQTVVKIAEFAFGQIERKRHDSPFPGLQFNSMSRGFQRKLFYFFVVSTVVLRHILKASIYFQMTASYIPFD
jgi:hypothetical protein